VKIERILRLCQVARTLHNDDFLPKNPKLAHAKIALGLSENRSIQDIAVFANCSVRTVQRYVKSLTIMSVADELTKSRLNTNINRTSTIDDIYEILFEKARNGDMLAIKEVIRLAGRRESGSEASASASPTIAATSITTTTTPPPSSPQYDNNWTAPSAKAEEHRSPPPEYLKVLSPAWVDGPISTDEDVELTDQLNS
jgi:AraC-like DNA-binding protein